MKTLKSNVVDLDLHRWCKRHDLSTEALPCPSCQELLETILPITYEGGCFGLKCAPCHKCGEKNTPKIANLSNSRLGKLFDEALVHIPSLPKTDPLTEQPKYNVPITSNNKGSAPLEAAIPFPKKTKNSL